MSIADAEASEGDGTMECAVTRDSSAGNQSVDWATADGKATSGTDYVAASGTLTFAPGESERTITIALIDDNDFELGEQFSVLLSNPSVGTLGHATAEGRILNDETSLDLAGLGSAGFAIDGAAAGDRSGASVASAGNVDGDGFTDLIVGAYYADPGGSGDAGTSYLIFGGF